MPIKEGSRESGKLSRRRMLAGGGAAMAAGSLAMPAIAQPAITGEVTFATNEWTLPHTARVLRRISETFSAKYPGAKVREIPYPYAGFHDQMLTQLTAGTPPDIIRVEDPQMSLYIERGFLSPLDDALREAKVNTAGFVAAGKDAMRDGKTYAVAYQSNARAMMFNKALLSDAGLAGPPKNKDEFADYIKRATKRDKGVFGYSLASKSGEVVGMFIYMVPIILGFGAHFTTSDGKPNAADPRIAEGLAFIKQMWDENSVPRGLDGAAALKLVTDGRVAMTLNGSFVLGAARDEVRPLLGVEPSPLPSGIVMRASSWFAATTQAKNKPAAIAWLMHMLEPENQNLIAESERIVPALPEFIKPETYKESPWLKTFVAGAATGVSYLPPGLGSKAFGQIKTIGEEIENILYRNKPIASAMGDLQKSLEANLRG
ncbi:MAG: extracellular solute-binding protein [Rhizobiales bacterium]|nr:extracellular solute-binding protein [Hyphomicrobiales bacterium]